MRLVLLLLLGALVLPGCIRPDAGSATPDLETQATSSSTHATLPPPGSLVVTARFTDLTPLAGVNVTVANVSHVTEMDGTARFASLAPGNYTVYATKTAHRAAQERVEIRPSEESKIELTLAPEDGGQHSHKLGFSAHRDLYKFDGHYDCSATYVIITGDCFILVENVTKTLGAPDPTSNATTQKNIIDFPLDVNWTSLVVEMTWNASAPTPATGQGMTLGLEPAEAPADGHAAKYARASGENPLRIALAPGVKDATATLDDMPNPNGGEVIRARAFVMGAAHNPGATDFLGVGSAKDQRFTLYVSIFYGETAPAGYSAHAK